MTTASSMRPVESVLVANRGEIAVRVIRAGKEIGLRTIAVYSELDRNAMHVNLADEAWNIGPAPAGESYLNIARILEVAAAVSSGGGDSVRRGVRSGGEPVRTRSVPPTTNTITAIATR